MRAEVEAKFDIPRIQDEVLESQQARLMMFEAMKKGSLFPWDFQPLRKASEQYTRNHMSVTDRDLQSRFPQPRILRTSGAESNLRSQLTLNRVMAKHIIIGTSGIGGALARQLAAQGASLHLISRTDTGLAAELGASLALADVTDTVAGLNKHCRAAGPVVDGLAYCVGTINLKPAHRTTDADVLKDFKVNALGALRAARTALPALKASKRLTPSVVIFSTVAVGQGFASHASVAMAKGAVEGLARTLAAEWSPKIRVNAIAPSLTRTPLASAMTANEFAANAIAAMHPLQRLGEAGEMAEIAAFLKLSGKAGWITGQVIGVDGGRSTLRVKA